MAAAHDGLTRAKALWKTAERDYAKHKRAAEATVATWQWVSRQVTTHEPGFFESNKFGRGKKLAAKPEKADYQAQEGFDAQGRLVALREYTRSWDDFYESFYFHLPATIEGIRYNPVGPAKTVCSARVFTTNERGVVIAVDSIYEKAVRARKYTLDERGHYTGFHETGVYDKQPVNHGFDFETNDQGRIVRSWWRWPTGKRDLYWEHSSVKGKTGKQGKASAAKAASKPVEKPTKRAKKQ